MKKILSKLLFIFILGASGSFFSASYAIQGGISFECKQEIDEESVIYISPVNLNEIPGLYYSDIGYFVKFRPLNMLSALEVQNRTLKDKKIRVNQTSLVPSVYNISFANGGSVNYKAGNEDIEEMVKNNPNRPEYIYAYALKLKGEKKYNAAINEIDKALKLDYNYALGHFLKADILRNMGNFKEAAKEYAITIEINPYCTDAYFNIAKMLEIYGNVDLALNYYEMAYEVSPNDLEIRNQILKLSRVRA